MAHTLRLIAAALGLIGLLAGCVGGPIADTLPEAMGGLPQGTPSRSSSPARFPAVHDMPPPRATTPLNEADQMKMEKDLEAIRDRQAGAGEPPPAAAKPAPAATKKKPAPGQ